MSSNSLPTNARRFGYALSGSGIAVMMAGASAPSPFYPQIQEALRLPAVGITVAFAIYAVTLLAALLAAGSLSDHVGRRPVASLGFVLLAVSVALIWVADSPNTLYFARGLQGLASGVLLAALSAAVTDFAPPRAPRNAALMNSITPMIGLALGSALAGLAIDVLADDALTAVFAALAGIYLVMAGLVWFTVETSMKHEGLLSALRPRVAIPSSARKLFVASAPAVIASWATGGLFLSLGAAITRSLLDVEGHFLQGAIIGLLPLSGAVGVLLLRTKSPRVSTIAGGFALAIGTAITLVGLGSGGLGVYLAGVVVAGFGFGTAFSGVIGSLIPTVAPQERAELFASLYVVSYLAFGIPAVVAGLALGYAPLSSVTLTYGLVVMVCGGAAAFIRLLRH